jgi:hypothetical protein
MELKFMTFLKYSIIILLNWSCTLKNNHKEDDYYVLEQSLEKEYAIKLNSDIKKIFVLTEENCMSCNKYFAEIIKNYQNKKSAIIIVNAVGVRVDISEFKKKKADNIYYSINYNRNNSFVNKTKAIFLDNKQIDTIINIEAKGLQQQIDFILEN